MHLFTDVGLVLTSSISGRNACPSEEVTFTCTAQTTAVFWGNKDFGEKALHYTSPPSGGDFRAEIVSYEQNCLVSSLSFHANASRNGTTVTCTSRDRSSNQSLSLHIMSSESIRHRIVAKLSALTCPVNGPRQLAIKGPANCFSCKKNVQPEISAPNWLLFDFKNKMR